MRVVEEIRKTGEYNSKKSIESETKSNTLIEHFTDKRIVYLGVVKVLEDYTIVKYGCTRLIKDTLIRHRNTYGTAFHFIYMTECEKHDELERSIQTHTDLTNRHIKEYEGNQRNELLKVDREYTTDKLITLIEAMKNAISSIPLELLLSKELTKQKELELENVRYQETTKQKEIETSLELKKLEFQLEMRKLDLQLRPEQVQPEHKHENDDCHIIKQYFESCTVASNNRSDAIKMSDLYKSFVEWLKIKDNKQVFSAREFTFNFKKLNLGKHENKISNLNGNSGIRNRKFIV